MEELGATVYAISVDTLEQSQEVADRGLTFPIAYGATREDADLIDAWWDENRGGYIQPAEFLLGRGGVVLGAMYASGPVGRMGAEGSCPSDHQPRAATPRAGAGRSAGGSVARRYPCGLSQLNLVSN